MSTEVELESVEQFLDSHDLDVQYEFLNEELDAEEKAKELLFKLITRLLKYDSTFTTLVKNPKTNSTVRKVVKKTSSGLDALEDVGQLMDSAPRQKFWLMNSQVLPPFISIYDFSFGTKHLLSYVGDISKKLNNLCKNGWFFIKIEDDGEIRCSISVKLASSR